MKAVMQAVIETTTVTTYVWLSFVCVSCGIRKSDTELHPLINGNAVCASCIHQYHKCYDCGLYMKGSEMFCTDCK